MRQKKLKLSAILLFGFGFAGLQAQQFIATSGGNASGSGGSASYSVGQVVYTSQTGANGTLIQGILQPYEISVLSGMEETVISLVCSAYPNPTTDMLVLHIENMDKRSLWFHLYNVKGNLLESAKIIDNKTTIPMKERAPAIYFLKVTDNKKEVKSFKIIKR
jgi:hypothetical protein